MDAFLNNKPCFLGEKRWVQVIHSAICSDEAFTHQRELVFALWGHLVEGPKMFKEVTDLITSSNPPPRCIIDSSIETILEDRDGLLYWSKEAQKLPSSLRGGLEICSQGTACFWPKFQYRSRNPQQITQLALWGTYALCRMIKGRLLVALSPSRFHALESEIQLLAGRIIELSQVAITNESERVVDQMFLSQSIWIAKAIVETKDTWSKRPEDGGAMIERWKFEAWCSVIGRTCYPSE
jgi:hypothetical protein